MDHTVHVVDVVRWFTGREVVSVYAEVDSMIHDIDIDDCGMLCMELEGGSALYPRSELVEAVFLPHLGRRHSAARGHQRYNICRRSGPIAYSLQQPEGKMVTHPFTEDMDLELIKDFVEMVETKRSPSITGFDGLQAMAVALALTSQRSRVSR